MANDNIKRYLDYDGLVYLINKFNSVIEANEQTTSEAINDLNQKIEELTDNTGGFPIIDADITQVDSVYTTTENLNELITPGQYIIDSSKIQYEDDTFIKTLYWLLSVDRVVYDNNESIVQTYYPLSYLSYKWFNIPVGGLLQRFYEGNNTWTDLQIAAPGDIDPTKYVSKTEFNDYVDSRYKIINSTEALFNISNNNNIWQVSNISNNVIDNITEEGLYQINYSNVDLGGSNFNGPVFIMSVQKTYNGTVTQHFNVVGLGIVSISTGQKLSFIRYYENGNIDPSEPTGWAEPIILNEDKEINRIKLNVGSNVPTDEQFVSVVSNNDISLNYDAGGRGFYATLPAVQLPTQKYIDENFIPKSESTNIWDAIHAGSVNNISLEKSGVTKTTTDEEVDIPYIENVVDFKEVFTGSFTGNFDVISLPTKNYVINNYVSNQTLSTTLNDYVSNQTLSTTLNDYVSKSSYIPNMLKNGTPQAYGEKDSSLQWYQTSNAITDTNSTDFNNICAPSYSDFNETSASYNTNSMVIRAFWNYAYFHDIWMSPNSDSILHRSITNNVAKPWKILLDNLNCGKYVKNAIKDSVDTNQITINNNFYCDSYANFRSSIGIYNSKHIELVSKAQSKLPNDSTASGADLGTDTGDIIFYKNVGKVYTNPDGTSYEGWPEFVSGKPLGSFTEHYGPMEICRIYASYTSANRCILNVRKAAGLVEEGNPQNQYVNAEIIDSNNFNYFLQQNNVITNSNIANNLPSTVLTTNNISHIEFKPSSGTSNGGFIDFHYGGSTNDFTSRIIEDAEGTITISSSILKATGKLTAASIDVTGNINVGGGVYETSDETLKDFQDSIQVNFEQLKEIPKAYFTFKDDKTDEVKIGTSAQKVKEFYPELVSENNEGILSVDYAKLSMVALKAVDILDDRITKLEKLVEQLLENK